MPVVLPRPKIYHITHLRNLRGISDAEVLWSDATRIERSLGTELIGMHSIKHRRLELEVSCHPGTKVGEYVPFYFCPRSVMLYILHMGNHPELEYKEGQRPIVHLEADLNTSAAWADENRVRWAFTDRNAGARYAEFYNRLDDLDQLDWKAVRSTDFRDPVVKDGKQAEFLVYESFPWRLVERIGVLDQQVAKTVRSTLTLAGVEHQPTVAVRRRWYY